ncbi:MAG: transposase [Armatimonadetes bacterium]|nr:transposase [Armatimonadota bacterium]MBI5834660.1 transposase [Armatimonadota bacterium]
MHLDLMCWQIPDEIWESCQDVLHRYDPPRITGRKRIAQRLALSGVLYHLHTGCCWNRLPRQFGDDSSVHRTLQRWKRSGAWEEMRAILRGAGLLMLPEERNERIDVTASVS